MAFCVLLACAICLGELSRSPVQVESLIFSEASPMEMGDSFSVNTLPAEASLSSNTNVDALSPRNNAVHLLLITAIMGKPHRPSTKK